MKKVLFILLCAFFSLTAHADQLAWISKQDADTAVKYLEKQKYVLLYCGCCDNDPKMYVKIKKVTCQSTGVSDYYEVIITGEDPNGNEVSEAVDLAYVHVQQGKKALCVGLALNMDCDPCDNNIAWKCPVF